MFLPQLSRFVNRVPFFFYFRCFLLLYVYLPRASNLLQRTSSVCYTRQEYGAVISCLQFSTCYWACFFFPVLPGQFVCFSLIFSPVDVGLAASKLSATRMSQNSTSLQPKGKLAPRRCAVRKDGLRILCYGRHVFLLFFFVLTLTMCWRRHINALPRPTFILEDINFCFSFFPGSVKKCFLRLVGLK